MKDSVSKQFSSKLLKYLALIGLLLIPVALQAATLSIDPFWGGATNLSNTGLGTTDPVVVASQIVNVFLRVLGLLSMLMMIYGGWIWLWARGNEEEIGRAKDIIRGAIIGLLVILASYGTMQWVFYYLSSITNVS